VTERSSLLNGSNAVCQF